MLQAFMLFAMCLMVTRTLHADGFSNSLDSQSHASNMASTYVPVESWVYQAFEQLAADGYLPTAFFSLRPWTRLDCARLVEEAEEQVAEKPVTSDAPALLQSLKKEFVLELQRRSGDRNKEFRLESLDQRVTAIAGMPLTDGYHFAQTLVDDDGRPFGKGANGYSGASFRGTAGPFAVYLNTEIQRVPSAPTPSSTAKQEIAHGEQIWATWQFSPRSSVEMSGRNMTVDREFLQGGTLRDLRIAADLALHPEWQFRLEEQTERWHFPLLSSTSQRNAEFTIQLSYRPLGRTKT